MIREFYDNPLIQSLPSNPISVWTRPTLLSPETTTFSSLYSPVAAFTTAEALASAKLLK